MRSVKKDTPYFERGADVQTAPAPFFIIQKQNGSIRETKDH